MKKVENSNSTAIVTSMGNRESGNSTLEIQVEIQHFTLNLDYHFHSSRISTDGFYLLFTNNNRNGKNVISSAEFVLCAKSLCPEKNLPSKLL